MRQTINLALILAVWLIAKVPIVAVPAVEAPAVGAVAAPVTDKTDKTDKSSVRFGQVPPLDSKLVRTIPIVALPSFNNRWQPTTDLPPMQMAAAESETVEATQAPLPKPPPPRAVPGGKRATDVCARHGQRRVEYLRRGYKMWRCQR